MKNKNKTFFEQHNMEMVPFPFDLILCIFYNSFHQEYSVLSFSIFSLLCVYTLIPISKTRRLIKQRSRPTNIKWIYHPFRPTKRKTQWHTLAIHFSTYKHTFVLWHVAHENHETEMRDIHIHKDWNGERERENGWVFYHYFWDWRKKLLAYIMELLKAEAQTYILGMFSSVFVCVWPTAKIFRHETHTHVTASIL